MNHQLEENKSTEIAVAPMLVWRALTGREIIRQSFFGTDAT